MFEEWSASYANGRSPGYVPYSAMCIHVSLDPLEIESAPGCYFFFRFSYLCSKDVLGSSFVASTSALCIIHPCCSSLLLCGVCHPYIVQSSLSVFRSGMYHTILIHFAFHYLKGFKVQPAPLRQYSGWRLGMCI